MSEDVVDIKTVVKATLVLITDKGDEFSNFRIGLNEIIESYAYLAPEHKRAGGSSYLWQKFNNICCAYIQLLEQHDVIEKIREMV